MSSIVSTGYFRVTLTGALDGMSVDLALNKIRASRATKNYSLPWTASQNAGAYSLNVLYCGSGGNVISRDSSDGTVSITQAVTPAVVPVPAPTESSSATPTPTPTATTAPIGTLNVRDYGAMGDGVTDDYAAVSKACAAAAASGNPVYLPDGTYLLSSTLTVPSGTTLVGQGMATTWLKGRILFGSNSTFTDLRMGSAGTSTSPASNSVSHTAFTRCKFRGGGGVGTNAEVINMGGAVNNLTFSSCDIERNSGAENASHSLHYDNVFINPAVVPPSCRDILFSGCHFGVSNGVATGCPRMNVEIWADPTAGTRNGGFSNINFETCLFEAAADANIDYSGSYKTTDGTPNDGYSHVTGCTFKGNGAGLNTQWYNDVTIERGCGHVTVSGNTFYRGMGHTVSIEAVQGTYNTVTNNVIDMSNNVLNTGITGDWTALIAMSSSYNTVTGNTIRADSRCDHVIRIYSGATNNTVSGNTITKGYSGQTAIIDEGGATNTITPNMIN